MKMPAFFSGEETLSSPCLFRVGTVLILLDQCQMLELAKQCLLSTGPVLIM